MEKMELYNFFGKTPKEAIKTIQAGKLKGMSDVNPMHRIKKLTERFGPQGIGWTMSIDDIKVVEAAGEQMVHVLASLRYKLEDGAWSEPVIGMGGSKLCGKGVGDGINDEAFKMAYTDAMSICCKGLGMCADIYYSKDASFGTKYDVKDDAQAKQKAEPQPEQETPVETQEDIDRAKTMFDNCKDIDELKSVFNDFFGGNNGASKTIKMMCAARLKQLRA